MESAYRKLIGEHPSSSLAVDAMLELGQTLFNRKAYAESQKWLLQVRESLEAQTVPLEPAAQTRSKELLERALFGLAFIAFEKEEFAEAASLFDRVAENAASPLAPGPLSRRAART
jgi:outer membrane protein assembly factor BamD (BamD/ComL family)